MQPDLAMAWYNKGLFLKILGNDIEANVAFDKVKMLGYNG